MFRSILVLAPFALIGCGGERGTVPAAGPGRGFSPAGDGRWSAGLRGGVTARIDDLGLELLQDGVVLGIRASLVGGGRHAAPGHLHCRSDEQAGCEGGLVVDRGFAQEWWRASVGAIEQGWTFDAAGPTGLIGLELEIRSGSVQGIDRDRLGAQLLDREGRRWRYGHLAAWDADHRPLRAWMEQVPEGLQLFADARGARFPVTVDPTLEQRVSAQGKLYAADATNTATLGYAVGGGADVDGDGVPDVVVGARWDDAVATDAGAAYIFYGTSTGLTGSRQDKLVASDAATLDYAGSAVAMAGDINADGYEDVLVGAWGDDDTATGSGSAWLWFGASTGAGGATKIVASDAAASDAYGWSLEGLGDVDGDGLGDLVISARSDDDLGSNSGSVYVYYGATTGLAASSEQKLNASDGDPSDDFGRAVGGPGDVDGDGYADLVVGAIGADDNGMDSGAAYLFYGCASGIDPTREDQLLASDGEASDSFGYLTTRAGDLDGDGFADVAISAPNDDDMGSSSGAVYLYYGASGGVDASSEVKIVPSDGAEDASFGVGLGYGGDIDGDGFDDLAIGAYKSSAAANSAGEAYLWMGDATRTLPRHSRILAEDAGATDNFGVGIWAAGDLDGDGRGELVVGSPGDDDAATNAGAAYIIGRTGKLMASDAAKLDYLGASVAGAGDVNADGFADGLAGAWGVDDTDTYAGAVYVWKGGPFGLVPTSEFKLLASDGAASDYLGKAVAGAGDLDADGYAEVAAGAPGHDDMGTGSGAVYLWPGGETGMDGNAELELLASDGAAGDALGTSLAGVGDLDGDGIDDLAAGAPGDDEEGSGSGSVYLWFGATTGPGTATELRLGASTTGAGRELGTDVARAGDVDGDGLADLLAGAPGDDRAAASAGAVYLWLGSATGPSAATEARLTASDAGAADSLGGAVAGAGDVDGDGYDDLLAGASRDDDNGAGAGAAYLWFGSTTGAALAREQKLLASDGEASDAYGIDVTGPGDLDLDGYDDVAVGAWLDDELGSASGSVYLYYGTATGLSLASEELVLASDGAASAAFGFALSGAGDIDGDGRPDLLVGAFMDSEAEKSGGAVYAYTVSCVDHDHDGVCVEDGDCDDTDASTWPGATEITGDGVDEDCDGTEICYADADGDGGTDGSTVASSDVACDGPGEAADAAPDGDCDEGDATVYAGAAEVAADGVDQDCDGGDLCYADADEDGYSSGTVASADLDCVDAGEATAAGGDCDDTDAATWPGATEAVADEVDQDCDGGEICYADLDEDGYTSGTVASTDTDCGDAGESLAATTTDCDDADPLIHPGATEAVGDEVDGDCDGSETCYADADGDGFTSGTVASVDTDCADAGEATSATTEDCDDAEASIWPGATEGVGDEVDSDCDGGETCYADVDLDGWTAGTVSSSDTDCGDVGEATSATTEDCDDHNNATWPGAPETPGDGIDSDCDGGETCYADIDGDGFSAGEMASTDKDCTDVGELAAATTEDCDDAEAAVFPGAVEEPADGVDGDCDGEELCYLDADEDGYASGETVVSLDLACDGPQELEIEEPLDCDDSDPQVYPTAPEPDCTDPTDYNCDGSAAYADADEDGYVACEDCNDVNPQIHPGATETCDGEDQDCDGLADNAAVDATIWYRDGDEDGYGDATSSTTACEQPYGTAGLSGDCDDGAPLVYPGAPEICGDGVDSDCDGAGGPEDDEDVDGLDWVAEVALGTDACDPDTDGDGLQDGVDPHPLDPEVEDPWVSPEPEGCSGCAGAPVRWSGRGGLLLLIGIALARRRRSTPAAGLSQPPAPY